MVVPPPGVLSTSIEAPTLARSALSHADQPIAVDPATFSDGETAAIVRDFKYATYAIRRPADGDLRCLRMALDVDHCFLSDSPEFTLLHDREP